MIDKYIAAIILVVSNIIGLTTLSNIEESTEQSTFFQSTPFSKTVATVSTVNFTKQSKGPVIDTKPSDLIEYYGIVFKHGDVSWLPELAAQAGWPRDTWPMLGAIILRESGGCPNRRGGDAVNKNCKITHVTEWNHRSDTGLLQINGVNYNLSRNKWARVCLDLKICEQTPLLDPLKNLKAGYLLYQYSGWSPWDPCTWGPEWSNRCRKNNNP